MARKIFVSYKHRDVGVRPLNQFGISSAREYVDRLEQLFFGDHIYKGERGNEDIGTFKDPTIESHLRGKIYDSSTTVVLISKNMREIWRADEDQWIPWEISYSLREKTRDGRTSGANAMLAVVLPDEYGGYDYFIEQRGCYNCGTVVWRNDKLFSILGANMFNRKRPNQGRCANGACATVFHTGNDHSYIHPVKWDEFVANMNWYINLAAQINANIDDYNVVKAI